MGADLAGFAGSGGTLAPRACPLVQLGSSFFQPSSPGTRRRSWPRVQGKETCNPGGSMGALASRGAGIMPTSPFFAFCAQVNEAHR